MFENDSVVDLGAGQGQYGILAEAVQPRGRRKWHSVDSTADIGALTGGAVNFADLTNPADIQGIVPADWALCIEAAEHAPQTFAGRSCCKFALSESERRGAVLGTSSQPGSHHVNGQPNQHAEKLFHYLGYLRDIKRESYLRDAIASVMDGHALEASHSGQSPLCVLGAP